MVRMMFAFPIKLFMSIAKVLSTFAIKQAISILKFAFPYAVRLIVFCLGAGFFLMVLGATTAFKGVKPVAEQMAKEWTKRTMQGDFPTLWEVQLRKFFYGLAITTICLSWLLISFIAYFTLDYVANLIL